MKLKLLAVLFGLAIGNFFAAFITTELYMVALERTYFQGIALFSFWICSTFLGRQDS